MTRSEFIRKTLLGLAAAAVLPATISFGDPAPKRFKRVSFKVSKPMLEDKAAFEKVMEPYRTVSKISEIQMGWEKDDFTKNLMTVLIKYEA